MALLKLLASAAATLVLYGVYQLLKFVYEEYTSPLRDLPGPESTSLLYGNFKEIFAADNSVLHEKWVQEYGHTIKYTMLLGSKRLFTMDTKALNHVLMNSYDYQKPPSARYGLGRIVGPGVLVVEEDEHRQQRKIMNPAFGPAQIRELTEIFVEKSNQLRDLWAAEITKEGGTGTARIDILSWLSKMTLDVIGLAGFSYKFDALSKDNKPNELNDAFATIFKSGSQLSALGALQAWFPIFRIFPAERGAEIRQARDTMSRIAKQLLQDSKASLTLASKSSGSSPRTRDLLSLLLRANTSTDIPQSQRLSDGDVLAQVPTFLVAGHETTSTGTTWALFALTQNMEAQTKLRAELLAVPTDNPTMEQLNALPYLDCVVRETLRVHAPVASTVRIAMKDDILPLNTPFTDKKGRVQHGIRIRKGQTLLIPILAMNRARDIWGDDSMEFRPERWESIPEAASSIPGVWGNMLTFLGGPRACIGYRFSLVEMKALLFALVRAFEFELAVPATDIIKKSSLVQRPIVVSDPEGGNQMPLLVKPYRSPSENLG